jgi:TatD DNase family protein
MLIDTHAHLNFPNFDEDLEDVLDRAKEAGVEITVVVGTNLETSRRGVEIADKFPNIYATVGIHPTEYGDFNSNSIEKLSSLVTHPKVVAIGEIGLDFFRSPTEEEKLLQQEFLQRQIRIANNTNLPVIIHNRESGNQMFEELNNLNTRAVFHCYTGNLRGAENIISKGHLISITGIITYSETDELRETVRSLPLSKIMLETDCPFLTPNNTSEKRNEPKNVKIIAQRVAEIRNISTQLVAEETTKTAQEFFNFL